MADTPNHFFKFISPGSKFDLSIPRYFWANLSREGRDKPILRRGCREWPVDISDTGVFGDGWRKFVKENGVQEFDFIVFKHQGNLVFDFIVFDQSTCERQYPLLFDEMDVEEPVTKSDSIYTYVASEIETLETKKQGDVVPDVEKEVEMKDKEEPEAKEEEEVTEEEEEDSKEEEGSTKRVRAKKGDTSSAKKVKTGSGSPITPIERPTRERKTVERYTESMGRLSAPKPFSVEKGSGTQLKEIPNVAYKLSKRKPDENLHSLHMILFNKRAKVNTLKKNIGMFSGFVWADDVQEKQRTKVKERLDKFTKEKLFDFCDILNLQIHKSQLKKEEVSVKLLEFLQSPHATTEVLLAEKEQKGKKQKGKSKSWCRTPSKKQSGEKRKRSSKTQEETNVDENEGSENEDDSQEEDENNTPSKPESDEEEDKSDEGGADDEELEDEPEKASSKKSVKDSGKKTEGKSKAVKKDDVQEEEKDEPEKTSSKKSVNKDSGNKTVEKSKAVKKDDVKTPTNKKSSIPGSKKGANASGSKVSSAKKAKEEKSSSKVDNKGSAKDQGKEKTNKKAKAEPTNEEMHAVVVGILKEVDFNTATLSDIFKQLGTHFGQDLLHRKSEVKDIITDVINNMSREEDGEEEKETEGGSDADEDDGDKNES